MCLKRPYFQNPDPDPDVRYLELVAWTATGTARDHRAGMSDRRMTPDT